jgi:hypothetical protein
LAESRGLAYSRYADDLALSSPTHLRPPQVDGLAALVARIASEEGFRVNPAKTSVKRRGQRQRLAGLVINERPKIARLEYELLKATLHNAVRLGPERQNRSGLSNYRATPIGAGIPRA